MTHLLIDTDILLYKAASSAEQEVDFGAMMCGRYSLT